MLIAIDGNEANVEEKVGVSVYTFELLKYFQKQSEKDLQFAIYLKNKPREEMPNETEFFRYRVVSGPFLWSRIFFPLALMVDRKPDVFFAPAHYLPPFVPTPAVVTIHDVAYEYFPNEFRARDLYQLKNWTRSSVSKAAKIIAVSQNTKSDVIKFYNVPENQVEVIYNGFNLKSEMQEKDSGVANAPQNDPSTITGQTVILANERSESVQNLALLKDNKYLLYVGTLQPRKNLLTLIETFSEIAKKKPDLKLVIAGKKGWLYEPIFQKVKELKLADFIIFTGYVSDSELIELYKNATIFILPSLYEGFGIPVLEAMSHDCPVVAANTSSLPEIGGEACLYFAPNNTVQLKKAIEDILENDGLRKNLIKKGQEQVKKFSWEKCGEETLRLLKSNNMSSPT